MRPKSFALLQLLVENAGRLLDRDAIMAAVWPDVFVTDNSITQCVRDIRRALGDEAQRLLRTVPRRGYLFAAEVSRGGAAPAAPGAAGADRDDVTKSASAGADPAERAFDIIRGRAPAADRAVCDLVGSTALSEHLDPEDFGELIRAYQERCTAEIVRFGGHVAKYMGDGVLAYFGYPRAHEDDAERAVRAALAIIGAVADWPARPASRPARVGIATGLVVSGPVGEGVGGGRRRQAANLAARLQEIAEPGAVVVADGTRRLLGEVFALRDLGPRAQGRSRTGAAASRVLGERPSREPVRGAAAGRAPAVGRPRPGTGAGARALGAGRAGEGQAVLLVGEPGIGKSRLVRARSTRRRGRAHGASLPVLALPHRHSRSAPWPSSSSRRRFETADGDKTKLDKLEALLRQRAGRRQRRGAADRGAARDRAGDRYPAPELTPQQRSYAPWPSGRAAARAGAPPPGADGARGRALDRPDHAGALGQALDRIADARVLILLTIRPEFSPPGRPPARHAAHPQPPRPRPDEAMVARLAGGRTLPPEVLSEIAARTDGVPLFVEELTKAVLESGRRDGGGVCRPRCTLR